MCSYAQFHKPSTNCVSVAPLLCARPPVSTRTLAAGSWTIACVGLGWTDPRRGWGGRCFYCVRGFFFKRRPSLQRRREGRAAAQGAFLALLVPFMELTQPLGVQRPSLGSQRSRTGRPVVQNRFFLFVWLPDSLSVFAPADCFPPGSPKFAPR